MVQFRKIPFTVFSVDGLLYLSIIFKGVMHHTPSENHPEIGN